LTKHGDIVGQYFYKETSTFIVDAVGRKSQGPVIEEMDVFIITLEVSILYPAANHRAFLLMTTQGVVG